MFALVSELRTARQTCREAEAEAEALRKRIAELEAARDRHEEEMATHSQAGERLDAVIEYVDDVLEPA